MANSTVGNLLAQATPLIGADIVPISRDGTNLNRTTLTNIKAFTDNNAFSTISVAGQSDVLADSSADTLTIVAGTNITITTNATTDTITINAAAGGGTASLPTFGADLTVGRDIATADLSKLLNYNSASIGTFIVPTDAALGLTGASASDSAYFKIFIKGTGRADIVAGSGVLVRKYAGFPTPVQYVMQTCTRVGVNEWTVE